ncbi:MAG: undecaprenyl/decaprenyl-phosphate alpha-N-acetylglucosaminyl 1-phosphate transferase [Spirochaetaceae bacterium]|nr:undecaprenyl/decaprenyl-phosphate alpha-N-acetylglucosaminyl 1-phosphate transferase [Spirochaetaceae bacterium]
MIQRYLPVILFPLIAFTVNLGVTPILIKLANIIDLHDSPDHRKIHREPISNFGGIGIFFSTVITCLIYGFFYIIPAKIMLLLPGFSMIHIVGILDDRFDMKARYKLLFQILSALIITLSGFIIKTVDIPFTDISIKMGYFSYFITIIWIISISNAINLIDGIDGQAGGISLIALLSIGVTLLLSGALIPALLSFILAGCVSGFLIFNYPPAKVFMGDGGSLLLGFAIAVLPLLSGHGSILPLAGPMTILVIPILDVFASIVRRRRKRQNLSMPDKEHTHHKLLDFGLSNRQILSIVYCFTGLFALISIYWSMERSVLAFIMILSSWVLSGSLFLILDRKYETKVRAKRRLENIRLIS